MTVTSNPRRASQRDTGPDHGSRRLWVVAGVLALVHVVLLFGALPLERMPLLGDSAKADTAALVTSSITRTFAGGYLETLSFVVLLLGMTLLTRLVRGRDELPGWLAASAAAMMTCFVTITIAVGFSAGAAAVYDGHHGAPLSTVVAVNDIRNFGYFLSLAVLAAFTFCLCAAGQLTRSLPRWISYGGYLVGGLLLVTVPAERSGVMDLASMLWYFWFVALAIVVIRRPGRVLPSDGPQSTAMAAGTRA